jgi:hypothetical protein
MYPSHYEHVYPNPTVLQGDVGVTMTGGLAQQVLGPQPSVNSLSGLAASPKRWEDYFDSKDDPDFPSGGPDDLKLCPYVKSLENSDFHKYSKPPKWVDEVTSLPELKLWKHSPNIILKNRWFIEKVDKREVLFWLNPEDGFPTFIVRLTKEEVKKPLSLQRLVNDNVALYWPKQFDLKTCPLYGGKKVNGQKGCYFFYGPRPLKDDVPQNVLAAPVHPDPLPVTTYGQTTLFQPWSHFVVPGILQVPYPLYNREVFVYPFCTPPLSTPSPCGVPLTFPQMSGSNYEDAPFSVPRLAERPPVVQSPPQEPVSEVVSPSGDRGPLGLDNVSFESFELPDFSFPFFDQYSDLSPYTGVDLNLPPADDFPVPVFDPDPVSPHVDPNLLADDVPTKSKKRPIDLGRTSRRGKQNQKKLKLSSRGYSDSSYEDRTDNPDLF